MAISPFSARPASPEGERRRARLALAIATVGIVATLVAYAVSPGVRHVVGHAAHSVKHAVSHVFDHHHRSRHSAAGSHGRHSPHLVSPLHRRAPGKRTDASSGPQVSGGFTIAAHAPKPPGG
jgi:hypothetical protein